MKYQCFIAELNLKPNKAKKKKRQKKHKLGTYGPNPVKPYLPEATLHRMGTNCRWRREWLVARGRSQRLSNARTRHGVEEDTAYLHLQLAERKKNNAVTQLGQREGAHD